MITSVIIGSKNPEFNEWGIITDNYDNSVFSHTSFRKGFNLGEDVTIDTIDSNIRNDIDNLMVGLYSPTSINRNIDVKFTIDINKRNGRIRINEELASEDEISKPIQVVDDNALFIGILRDRYRLINYESNHDAPIIYHYRASVELTSDMMGNNVDGCIVKYRGGKPGKIMKMILLNMKTEKFEWWDIEYDEYAHILISVSSQLDETDYIRVSRKLKAHPETVDKYHFYLSPVEDIYSNIIIYNSNNQDVDDYVAELKNNDDRNFVFYPLTHPELYTTGEMGEYAVNELEKLLKEISERNIRSVTCIGFKIDVRLFKKYKFSIIFEHSPITKISKCVLC